MTIVGFVPESGAKGLSFWATHRREELCPQSLDVRVSSSKFRVNAKEFRCHCARDSKFLKVPV